MSDLIDRQAAIDAVNKLVEWYKEKWHESRPTSESVIDVLNDLPSAQSQWILCSERLPKYPYRVQIQLDNGWIITGYYSEEHWYTVPHCGGFLRNDEVEAWRELPELYGGSDAK